jgi:hypothetical protein
MRALTVVFLLLLLAQPASAQETTPVVELAAGYSLLQTDDETWSGWMAAGSITIVRWFGVEIEAGKNFFSEEWTFDGQTYTSRSTAAFAGVGPRFVARARRVSSFTHVLFGAEKPHDEYLPSLQVGTGGDFWITRTLGVRGGIDGRVTWYEEDVYGVWRFHTGVVIALGSR